MPIFSPTSRRVRAAQLRAVVSVNRELILLYWDIGKIIVEAQTTKGYGKQVVERLAEDLQKEFPGTAGFSPQNVWYMRSFYFAFASSAAHTLQKQDSNSDTKPLRHNCHFSSLSSMALIALPVDES